MTKQRAVKGQMHTLISASNGHTKAELELVDLVCHFHLFRRRARVRRRGSWLRSVERRWEREKEQANFIFTYDLDTNKGKKIWRILFFIRYCEIYDLSFRFGQIVVCCERRRDAATKIFRLGCLLGGRCPSNFRHVSLWKVFGFCSVCVIRGMEISF